VEPASAPRTLAIVLVRYASVPPMAEAERSALRSDVGELHGFADLHDEVVETRGRRLFLLAVLNGLDLLTTALVLGAGGGEANPVLAPVAHLWWAPLLVKSVVFSVVMWAILRCPIRSTRSDRMIRVTCAFYVCVVAWNLSVLVA